MRAVAASAVNGRPAAQLGFGVPEGSPERIKILIADDYDVVRAGLRFLLEKHADMEIVGEAADGRQALHLAEALNPPVIVMGVAMPQLNGIDAAAHILHRNPEMKIVLLSTYADQESVVRALTAGVKGFLVKESVQADLVRAVRAVAAGSSFFSPAIAHALAEDYVAQLKNRGIVDSYELLTEREREVLQLLAEGKSNKEVGALLDVSTHTVESHRMHLMQKLNLHNTAEIVLYAVRKKIVA
jgi:DNA-binding NarL/FixJ family response regulator